MSKKTPKIALTIDVEDTYPNAVDGVEVFLKKFRFYEVKATFFITGEVLEKYPAIVSAIAQEGHEIASHGYTHYKATESAPSDASYLLHCSPQEMRAEVEKSYTVFKNRGYQVMGFRAPSFGMDENIFSLVKEYFQYDSSYIEGKFKSICETDLVEFPISRLPWLAIPFGTPYLLKLHCLRNVWNVFLPRKELVVFYGHCYDFITPNTKLLKKSMLKKCWYHRECGAAAESFYNSLLDACKAFHYTFVTLRECMEKRQ
jgi:peptidoglycan/xylan/chitin deacetylase (PgdA/CDA1 family)